MSMGCWLHTACLIESNRVGIEMGATSFGWRFQDQVGAQVGLFVVNLVSRALGCTFGYILRDVSS